MKNKIRKTLALVLALITIFSFNTFAVDVSTASSQQELEITTDLRDSSARVTGLINSYYIEIDRNGDYMNLVAKVFCAADVVKCGFKEIVIYRRVTGTTSWSVVTTLEDIYDDTVSHVFTYSLQILPNFDYRATCVHYAKKSLLLTQTIDDSSNVI